MKLENYNEQQTKLPKTGKHIIAETVNDTITVYQAFNPQISKYAVANQQFGGNHYSFNRMTWIKPNFMWMMYRAGWATKINQERILAVKLKLAGFEEILLRAVASSFKPEIYGSHEHWKARLKQSPVRLQWDPDHNPIGEKLERKAIQIGLKGDILKQFNTEWITEIQDITPFVKEQHPFAKGNFNDLQVPFERVVNYNDRQDIIDNIGLTL